MKLANARTELALLASTALADDVGVIDHLPDSIAPPVVLVAWSDPWLEPATLCAWQAKMELLIVSQRLEPGGNTERLEEIVSALVPPLKASQWFQINDVTSPYPLQIAGVDYLAASINITHDVEDG